jgi:hypothetical protein
MVVQHTAYKVVIDVLTGVESIEQRVQCTMGGKVYDINWDSVNERVICNGTGDEWWEIRNDNVLARDIVLQDVLFALNYTACPTLMYQLNNEYTIENYLVSPISTKFLIQMDLPDEVIEDDTEGVTGAIEYEDEDPSSSEDCDNPSLEE